MITHRAITFIVRFTQYPTRTLSVYQTDLSHRCPSLQPYMMRLQRCEGDLA
jgi:hypothetical protein